MSYIDNERTLKIGENELRYLIRCRCQYEALEAAGVEEKYERYQDAMEQYVNDYYEGNLLEKPEDAYIEDVVKDIIQKYEEV